jgi:hypothetical protein
MKMRKTFVSVVTVMLVFGLSISTHADLVNLGGGMIYSTDLNLTWLQDANYAQTSGYAPAQPNGLMTWDQASTWATTLVYGGVTGWRLPTFDPAHPGQCYSSLESPSEIHEMMYLLRTELGNSYYVETDPDLHTGNICLSASPHNYGPFINVETAGAFQDYDRYWSGTIEITEGSGSAWEFYFGCG